MCGILGIYKEHETRQFWEQSLLRCAESLRHRGPDDQGLWYDEKVGIGLAHRRLAIIDLSENGRQPMQSSSGRFVLTYNGEIYNYLEKRSALQKKGIAFRGHSDTETLLASFESEGIIETLNWISGMYAFGVWDREKRILHLVRDRLGEKPLYYGYIGKSFVFASELKAFRAFPGFSAEIDRHALSLLLRKSCIPAPLSIYRGILKLPPASFLSMHGKDLSRGVLSRPVPYWSMRDSAGHGQQNPLRCSDEEAAEQLEHLLLDTVQSRMISDVPLGAFLSGGIDSSTITALMQASNSRKVKTFSIGYEEQKYNEADRAEQVAAYLGTEHMSFYVTAQDALDVIPLLPEMYDEPFSDSSQIPTYLVSKLSREYVTVCLTGDGGDEFFAGYNRHIWGNTFAGKVLRIPAAVRKGAARSLTLASPQAWDVFFRQIRHLLPSRLRLEMPGDKVHKFADALHANTPDELYRLLTTHWRDPDQIVLRSSESRTTLPDARLQLDGYDFMSQMQYQDAVSYLPDDILTKVDRASMSVGLEVRPPFLDHRVVEFSWRLPMQMKLRDGKGKWILRKVLHKYVSEELVERPKMGFGVPIDSWLRGPLRDWAEDLLADKRLRREGFFNPDPIRKKWQEHLSGKFNWQYHLWDVLMFQAWLRQHNAAVLKP